MRGTPLFLACFAIACLFPFASFASGNGTTVRSGVVLGGNDCTNDYCNATYLATTNGSIIEVVVNKNRTVQLPPGCCYRMSARGTLENEFGSLPTLFAAKLAKPVSVQGLVSLHVRGFLGEPLFGKEPQYYGVWGIGGGGRERAGVYVGGTLSAVVDLNVPASLHSAAVRATHSPKALWLTIVKAKGAQSYSGFTLAAIR